MSDGRGTEDLRWLIRNLAADGIAPGDIVRVAALTRFRGQVFQVARIWSLRRVKPFGLEIYAVLHESGEYCGDFLFCRIGRPINRGLCAFCLKRIRGKRLKRLGKSRSFSVRGL
jgi:hypothetical protein